MSKNTKLDGPSPVKNDEIIEEITKDLQDTNFSDDTPQKVEGDPESAPSHIPEDFDKSDSELETGDSDADSDLEALKSQELDLTDEEKEVKRQEAVTLKNRGNDEFKREQYLESIQTYTEALRICPLSFEGDRAILYSNRAACKIKVERRPSAIKDCTKALKLNDKYVKAYLRRAKLYEETEKLDESLEDYKKVLELEPGHKEAFGASVRLPPMISERNEKMKTEMLGKLKDLGNLFLRPFGLSTNNFQMQQDPNSGGYSINFKQNPSN